jgi:hypothetical protein
VAEHPPECAVSRRRVVDTEDFEHLMRSALGADTGNRLDLRAGLDDVEPVVDVLIVTRSRSANGPAA